MKQWHELLQRVMLEGEERKDRTGVGTRSLFGMGASFYNTTAFPAVTTKRLGFDQVKAELAAFVHGAQTLAEFHRWGCTLWNKNAAAQKRTYLGPMYGAQWREWAHIDQLAELVENVKKDPWSRRHLVSAWNVEELESMLLPPCHHSFQVSVRDQGRFLDMIVNMRSVDLFLGLPFDVASYALLQRLIAKDTNLMSGNLTFFMGDAHIYSNHFDAVKTVLAREPLPAPVLHLWSEASALTFEPQHARLDMYQAHEAVKAELNA